MASYPIVKIPQRFLQIDKVLPAMPPVPIEPVKPAAPETPKQQADDEVSANGSGCVGLPILLFGAFFIYVGSRSSGNLATGFGIVSLVIGLFVWFKNYAGDSKSVAAINRSRQGGYRLAVEKYNSDKSQYEVDLRDYEKKVSEYKVDRRNYDLTIEKLVLSEEYKKETVKLRRLMVKSALDNSSGPVYCKSTYKKGVSEEFFYLELLKFFEGIKVDILRNNTFPHDNFKRPFLPDFIVFIKQLNQCVVIEIDEPYVGKDGSPIHYLDSNDKFRDRHFLAHGWIVIRFAEEQIIRQPELCISFLVDTLCQFTPSREVDSIRSAKKFGFSLSSLFSKDPASHVVAGKVKKAAWDLDMITRVPCWSKDESHRMAFARYRNSYLPSELMAKIKEEDYLPITEKVDEPLTAFNKEEVKKRDEEWRRLYSGDDDNDLPF
ncbi:MAG: hypothetical protein EOO61_05890 [Hymenobacter sp.]|nr:MAG: hypothetical protein EOO61_05890 [Hymenobacter sp.]